MKRFSLLLLVGLLLLAPAASSQDEVKFTPHDDAGADFLTTELNSVPADDECYLSAAVDPQTDSGGDMFVTAMLELDPPGVARDGGAVTVYIYESLDGGTTYPIGCVTTTFPDFPPVCILAPPDDTTAFIGVCPPVAQPPEQYKWCLCQRTGQDFDTTGNRFSYATFTQEIN